MISSEAIIGIGITVAELGALCLLLGWAEHMRSVPKVAVIWLALGALLVIIGGLAAAFAWSRDRRPVRIEPVPTPDAPKDEVESVREPEEQRY
jgi:hypothetical protein